MCLPEMASLWDKADKLFLEELIACVKFPFIHYHS